MSDETFKPGDTVRLKSGGPPMTVKTADHEDAVVCVWFNSTTQSEGIFGAAMLEPYKKPRPTIGLI